MLGKFWKGSGQDKPEESAKSEQINENLEQDPVIHDAIAQAGSDAGVASFDQLGQTLVTTFTKRTISGDEAVSIVGDICARLASSSGACRHIVLDLQNVEYMDSGCVGVLVDLLTRLHNAGGRIALANTAHNVEYLFKLTRLDRLFPICRDVMKAIEVVERTG